jgi:hypothetical protein
MCHYDTAVANTALGGYVQNNTEGTGMQRFQKRCTHEEQRFVRIRELSEIGVRRENLKLNNTTPVISEW